MSEKMECPNCGKELDSLEFTIGENGNPICLNCAAEEQEKEI